MTLRIFTSSPVASKQIITKMVDMFTCYRSAHYLCRCEHVSMLTLALSTNRQRHRAASMAEDLFTLELTSHRDTELNAF